MVESNYHGLPYASQGWAVMAEQGAAVEKSNLTMRVAAVVVNQRESIAVVNAEGWGCE